MKSTQSPEQCLADKRRFNFLRKRTRGYSNRLSTPMKGKNKAERARLSSAFAAFGQHFSPLPFRV